MRYLLDSTLLIDHGNGDAAATELPRRLVEVARFEDRHHVVLDRELAEHRRFLRQIADAGLGALMGVIEDVRAREGDLRLSDLSPAELRKVRDYERRNANRKTVLNSIENKLS